MELSSEQVRWIVKECKLHEGKVDPMWIHNFAFGIHSDIPICGVVFFCNIWTKLAWTVRQDISIYRPGPDEAQHIQCPDCSRSNRIVKIHICKPDHNVCFINPFNEMLKPSERRKGMTSKH